MHRRAIREYMRYNRCYKPSRVELLRIEVYFTSMQALYFVEEKCELGKIGHIRYERMWSNSYRLNTVNVRPSLSLSKDIIRLIFQEKLSGSEPAFFVSSVGPTV